jgi:hypothetical protein
MTLDQREQLLNGAESVDAGTICLCERCRNSIFSESSLVKPMSEEDLLDAITLGLSLGDDS